MHRAAGVEPSAGNLFMETALLILALILLAVAGYLFTRAQNLTREIKTMKDELSQIKNIGDLLSVTEDTLEEAGKAINTAKRLMDGRIHRMEELLEEIDEKLPELERLVKSAPRGADRDKSKFESEKTTPIERRIIDPDREERELIARRNKKIILMLEEGRTPEEIARETGASLREIKLIQKFIK